MLSEMFHSGSRQSAPPLGSGNQALGKQERLDGFFQRSLVFTEERGESLEAERLADALCEMSKKLNVLPGQSKGVDAEGVESLRADGGRY